MSTWNPELTAANEVRREAEKAGVLSDYLVEMACWEALGIPPSIQERQAIMAHLVAEKEKKE